MTLSATVKVSIEATQNRTADFEAASSRISDSATLTLTDGTGASQADVIWKDTRTIASNEDLDLSGALTNIYGQTAVFARIKAIIIKASSSNTRNVNVSRPASNGVPLFLAASDGMVIRPGGFFAWGCSEATGVVVTAGTGDLINIANGTPTSPETTVTYNITIIGASA